MADINDEILLADVARMYYEQDMTQEEIAKRLNVSRSGVSRMLTRSRELGLVQIQIRHPLQIVPELEQELMRRFGLRAVHVLATKQPGEDTLPTLGILAARYVEDLLQENMTVGLSWGTSMLHMVNAMRAVRRHRMSAIQLMGSISANAPDVDGPEIARRFAALHGASCYYLHAPLLVQSATVRESLQQERNMSQTFAMMAKMDLAIVGVGAVRGSSSGLFRAGYLSEDELRAIREQGAVGDVCGRYFTIGGTICSLDLHDRLIGANPVHLRATPLVVGIAGGPTKSGALLGAIHARLVSVVMTDEECARAVLDLDDAHPTTDRAGTPSIALDHSY